MFTQLLLHVVIKSFSLRVTSSFSFFLVQRWTPHNNNDDTDTDDCNNNYMFRDTLYYILV